MSVWTGTGMQFLDIHFLDVGHGDCTVVEFPERLTVIDINNCKSFGKETEAELRRRNQPPPPNPYLPQLHGGLSALAAGGLGALGRMVPPPPASPTLADLMAQIVEARLKLEREKDKLTDPITYYKAHFTGRPIFRYVQTHPDMDHMAGLHRIWAEEKIPILNFWDTKHCIEKDEVAMLTGEVNHEIKDWQTYKQFERAQAATRRCFTSPTVQKEISGTPTESLSGHHSTTPSAITRMQTQMD